MSLGIGQSTQCGDMSEKPSNLRIMLAQPLCEDAMRLLPLMLLVVCCSVNADWIRFSETDISFAFYDPNSISKKGNVTRGWIYWDLRNRAENGALSIRAYREVDCLENKTRSLQIEYFSENSLNGRIVEITNSPGDWSFIPPGTAFESLRIAFCKK